MPIFVKIQTIKTAVFVKIQTIKMSIFVKIQTFVMCSVGGVDTATPVAAGHKQRARHVWGRVGRVMFIAVIFAGLTDLGDRAGLADLGAGGDVGGGGAERQ